MELNGVISGLSALAHETRLRAFRLLVEAGPEGLPAGQIATQLAVPAATASFHLKELTQAGLAATRREGRSVIYSPNVTQIRALLDYLTLDCCRGHPELCGFDGKTACTPKAEPVS